MLTRCMEECVLWGKEEVQTDGTEKRECFGEIRAAFSSRSAEEVLEDDTEYARETVYALIPVRYEPRGGFVRGMLLRCAHAEYRMLTPVRTERYWNVKCARIHL